MQAVYIRLESTVGLPSVPFAAPPNRLTQEVLKVLKNDYLLRFLLSSPFLNFIRRQASVCHRAASN